MPRTRVSEERFVVAYDGPALADHTMSARDLARSVLAMSEAFHEAQRVLGSQAAPASLNIQAFNGGSFEVAMTLVETAQTAVDLFNHPATTAVLNAAGIGGLVWGAFALIKRIGGRRITDSSEHEPGMTTLTLEDGTTLTTAAPNMALYLDAQFRRRLLEILEPLRADGVDSFGVRGVPEPVVVTSRDLASYELAGLPDEQELSNTTREVLVQLLSVEFDGRKWRFTEGESTFSATIEDAEFKGRVERQEVRFGSSDLLRIMLRTRQFRTRDGKLRLEHAVTQVLEHISGGQQLSLDLDGHDPADPPA